LQAARRIVVALVAFVLAAPTARPQPRPDAPSGWNDPRFAPAVDDPVARRCDELADTTSDPQKVGRGVAQDEINAAQALPACHEAAAHKPERARYQWLFGRPHRDGRAP
jgi:hypothetical protein